MILVVDDELELCLLLVEYLECYEYVVCIVVDVVVVWLVVVDVVFDLVIFDVYMFGEDGFLLLCWLCVVYLMMG